jgi:hypothetical protein
VTLRRGSNLSLRGSAVSVWLYPFIWPEFMAIQ